MRSSSPTWSSQRDRQASVQQDGRDIDMADVMEVKEGSLANMVDVIVKAKMGI